MEQIIKEYIGKQFLFDDPQAVIEDDQNLIEDGIIDSLGIFTLIAFIEQQFGIKIQPEDVVLDNFQSVNTVKSLILSKQPSAQTAGMAPGSAE